MIGEIIKSTREFPIVRIMHKAIAITAFKRPHSLKELLESLCRNNNLDEWTILIQLEPSQKTDNCIAISKQILRGYNYEIRINKSVKGVRKNTFDIVKSTFNKGANLVLYLEEDLVVSPDTLEMCTWYYDHFSDSDEILCLNLIARITGSSACLSSERHPQALVKTRSFNSLGIAITKRQWAAYFEETWLSRPQNHLTHLGQQTDGWDFSIYSLLLSRPHLYVLQPILARSNHVGGKGTYCTDEYQSKSFSYVRISIKEKISYQIVSIDSLESTERAFLILMDEMNSCILTLKTTEYKRRENLRINLLEKTRKTFREKLVQFKSLEPIQLLTLAIKNSRIYKFGMSDRKEQR